MTRSLVTSSNASIAVRSLFVAVATLGGSHAVAQPRGVAVELFGGLAVWFPSLETTYDASYTPSRVGGIGQLFDLPDPRSRANQELSLQGETSLGFGAGLNVYPHEILGFQFLIDRARVGVDGENPPHTVELTYDTIAFPSSDRVVRTTSFAFDSPDTVGSLSQTSVSFNATARFGRSGIVGGSFSGGLTYFRLRVEADRIGAHAAWLGGHAVLFSELYEASITTGTAEAFGFNLGGQVDLYLGSRVALFLDARLFLAPETEVEVALNELVSTNVVTVPLSRIDTFLDLPPLAVDPSFLRVLFGVKWKI
jgi:hypothetical protein